jgi:CubicO group peptidase (beta-lactamase class C family)
MTERVTPESVGLSSHRLERITAWMERHVRDELLPGVSVLVYRGGGVPYFGTAGLMDREAGKPLAEDTIFRIYSMTKPVTSVAAMMLFEEGRFQLDDPIARYLPEFRDMQVLVGGDAVSPRLEPAREPITVRHLLTHTSGLTYWFMNATAVDALYRENGVDFVRGEGDLASMVERLADLPLLCQPGSEWNYSVSTDVLGRLVEVISGESLDRFFRERIFEPLGMVDTGFAVPGDRVHRFAAMYEPAVGGGLDAVAMQRDPTRDPAEVHKGLRLLDAPSTSPYAHTVHLFSGGGGLCSTSGDYLRFCRMLLNGGELEGVRLLGRRTLDFMTTNHLPGDLASMGQPRFSEAPFDGIGFGLGFAVMLDPPKAQTMGSPGDYAWGGAASTAFWVDPAEDMIVILMTQLMPSSTYALRRELRALTYQALVD